MTGPQGRSFEEMRGFLDEIGPHWVPVEFDPQSCITRESRGTEHYGCCASEDLLKSFTATHIRRSNIQIADLPKALQPDFFRLGLFMDWLAPQRQEIIERKAEMGTRLKNEIMEYRAKYEKDPDWLDRQFPRLLFRSQHPATFVHVNLARLLILESKSYAMMPNDAIDFGQAVVSSAYASVATLDKHWKRRLESLPKPNGLAKIYCSPHLDQMVRDIERQLDRLALTRGRAFCSAN